MVPGRVLYGGRQVGVVDLVEQRVQTLVIVLECAPLPNANRHRCETHTLYSLGVYGDGCSRHGMLQSSTYVIR